MVKVKDFLEAFKNYTDTPIDKSTTYWKDGKLHMETVRCNERLIFNVENVADNGIYIGCYFITKTRNHMTCIRCTVRNCGILVYDVVDDIEVGYIQSAEEFYGLIDTYIYLKYLGGD